MVDRPELSLVMPAYNEGRIIEQAFKRVDDSLRKTGIKYELIVVDDGSADDTRKKTINYASNNNHVKVLGYNRNVGKGFATKTGLSHSTGNAIVILDSDLNIDPDGILNYIEALKQGDLVIASKWHPQSCVEIPLFRKFLSHGFNVLVKLLTGLRLGDTQTGLKAISRKAVNIIVSRLAVKRYAFDVELLTLANLYNLKIIELPVNIQMSGLFSIREVWKMFIDLLGITYRLRIIKYYQR
jgi:glycosyltransferase involved in cell wall biosynthesis